MLPYNAVGTPRRTALTVALMAAVLVAPVPNIESDVATYIVPDGSMLTILHDQPLSMYLQARHQVNRVAAAAGSLVSVPVQITGSGRKLIRTPRAGRAFPCIGHPDLIAYTLITGGQWTPARVLSVDWEAGACVVETPSNASSVRVYYTFGDGEISLRAGRPFGSSSGSIQLWRTSARGLHEMDQTDRDTSPYAVRSPKPVPENYALSIAVRAVSAVYFDGLAQHQLSIPVSDTAIQVLNAAELADLAERQLRGG